MLIFVIVWIFVVYFFGGWFVFVVCIFNVVIIGVMYFLDFNDLMDISVVLSGIIVFYVVVNILIVFLFIVGVILFMFMRFYW